MKRKLVTALSEKDVENAFKSEMQRLLNGAKINSPYNSDGLLIFSKVRTLLEFKYDIDLKSKREQANVFTQLIYYLKRFEQDGVQVPSTLFVGDKDECFALETKKVKDFLNRDIDWELAPSNAHTHNPGLVKAIIDDTDICPMVFDIDENFKLKTILDKLKDLSEGLVSLVKIDKTNIVEAFRYWRKYILKKGQNLSVQEEVSFFIYNLVDKQNTFEHPQRKEGVLVTTYNNQIQTIKINKNASDSFFSHFKREYSPSEIEIISGCKDRLVDEIERRKTGEFFTPTIWAIEAHKMISQNFGNDWTEKFIVWDCCSGTNNLTRDIPRFNNLFCSTLNQEDITTVKKLDYNPEATFFQFDFLNDPLEELPTSLLNELKNNKPFLFFINPPFATAGEKKTVSRENKKGTSLTKINETMKLNKIGRSREQLYVQFLYRIYLIKEKYNLTNVKLAFFSKPSFITGSSFKGFREVFYENFHFKDGMILRADNFSDVSDAWGVSFTLWYSGREFAKEFTLSVKEVDKETYRVQEIEQKLFYNSDNNQANNWVRAPLKKCPKFDAPQLTNAINIKQDGSGKMVPYGFGYMHNNSNNVMQSDQYVGLYSSAFSDGHGVPINKDNLMRAVALFAARKSVIRSWINDKDEFLIPDYEHEDYTLWNNNALIYSLFHSASNQSSLRNIEYKQEMCNINNHFFYLSNCDIKELADKFYFQELYNDAKRFSSHKPYVNMKLEDLTLSPEATLVLDKARKLVKISIPYRKTQHELFPEFHLQAWDAGWYQIRKGILEKVPELNDELNEFKVLYKELELLVREGVYKYSFLKE